MSPDPTAADAHRAEVEAEHAALRRVATLVAQGVHPDAQALVVVGLGSGNKGVPIGSRWELDDLVAESGVGRRLRVAR